MNKEFVINNIKHVHLHDDVTNYLFVLKCKKKENWFIYVTSDLD